MSDRIHIRDLRVRMNIGVAEWEKKARQDIVINITIHHDQRKAAATDDLQFTVDYKGIRDEVVAYVESTPHELLETLAEHLASKVLSRANVIAVDVSVDKPGALRFSDSVAVEIHRAQAATA